jgi:hypothetical protein
VVEDHVSYVWRNADLGHVGLHDTTSVVMPRILDAGRVQDSGGGLLDPIQGSTVGNRKAVGPPPECAYDPSTMDANTIFALALVAGGAALGLSVSWLLWNARQSATWPSAPGMLISSTVQEDSFDSDSISHRGLYRMRLTYQFQVGDRTIEGHRLFFGDFFWGWYKSEKDVRQRFQRYLGDAPFQVFHHPTRPGRSTLIPGVTNDFSYHKNYLVAALLLAVGVGIMMGTVRVE